jgi:hypothetical protein
VVDLVYYYGKEIIIVRILNDNLFFCKLENSQLRFAPIEGLKFSEAGIRKEFPDLSDKPFDEAKKIAIQRLRDKIKSMKTEKDKIIYLKEDLEKFGYVLKIISREGYRPISWGAYNNAH